MTTTLALPEEEAVLLHPERWQVILPSSGEHHRKGEEPDRKRRNWSLSHAHRGPHRELLLCLGGRGYFGLAGRVHRCRPGTLFVIDPAIDHDNYYPVTADGLEHLWIRSMGPHIFASWFRISRGRLRQLYKPLSVMAERELGVLASALSETDSALSDAMRAARFRMLVGLVALHLVRCRHQSAPPGGNPAVRIQAQVVEAICAHIEATAGKGVTLDVLSEFSGYSKFHLLRLFQKQAGCTIHQYIDRIRVNAVRRLQSEGKTNGAIAEVLGFSSPTSFIRWRRQTRKE